MKKVYISKVLFIIGFVLLGCFALSSGHDCYMYYKPIGGWQYLSSPLWLYIIIRAIEFLLPAMISMVVAHVFKIKCRTN